jgi:hypothetical protein
MKIKQLLFIAILFNFTACFKQTGNHEYSSNPNRPDDKVTISNPTVADSAQGSGGTEVVGTVDELTTFHPVFAAFHQNNIHSTRYKVHFESTEPTFVISQISVVGKNLDMESISPEINVVQISSNTFEITSNEYFLLEKLNFKTSFDGSNAKLDKINVEIEDKNIFEDYFKATHLRDNRYGFIKKNQQSTLATTNTAACISAKAKNHLGQCIYPISLCSDFHSQFENPNSGLTPCRVERDGLPLLCFPVTNKTICEQKFASACSQMINYLDHAAQLIQVYHSDALIGSRTCLKPVSSNK